MSSILPGSTSNPFGEDYNLAHKVPASESSGFTPTRIDNVVSRSDSESGLPIGISNQNHAPSTSGNSPLPVYDAVKASAAQGSASTANAVHGSAKTGDAAHSKYYGGNSTDSKYYGGNAKHSQYFDGNAVHGKAIDANHVDRGFATGTASTNEIGDNELVTKNVAGILDEGGVLMDIARTAGKEFSNSRGMMNSSMASRASMRAMMDTALPMAQQDAATYLSQLQLNQRDTNAMEMFNTGADNDSRRDNQNAENTQTLSNQRYQNEMEFFNKEATNRQNLTNQQYQNENSRFNAGADNTQTLANQRYQNENSQFNANARNTQELSNQRYQNENSQFNAGADNTQTIANQDAINRQRITNQNATNTQTMNNQNAVNNQSLANQDATNRQTIANQQFENEANRTNNLNAVQRSRDSVLQSYQLQMENLSSGNKEKLIGIEQTYIAAIQSDINASQAYQTAIQQIGQIGSNADLSGDQQTFGIDEVISQLDAYLEFNINLSAVDALTGQSVNFNDDNSGSDPPANPPNTASQQPETPAAPGGQGNDRGDIFDSQNRTDDENKVFYKQEYEKELSELGEEPVDPADNYQKWIQGVVDSGYDTGNGGIHSLYESEIIRLAKYREDKRIIDAKYRQFLR